ncbi:hypothetical protein GF340_00960 [Candidatus Peregrinibacteria bacterium]|nr:hypothetical protein [Candidatus Peregrinibacteria bacterium]
MKKLFTFLSVFLLVIFSAGTSLAQFNDLANTHPNYVAITYLNEEGVINGYPDNTYQPEKLVNRVEALKVILEGNSIEINDPESTNFTDVNLADWFTKYIETAKGLGIVEGNPDGSFAPGRDVIKAEFLKMLLMTNHFKKEKWEAMSLFNDIPENEWYTPYMNYAGQAGLIMKDEDGNLNPAEKLNRGEVAEIMYLMTVILHADDTQFLVNQAERQMAQIDLYIDSNNPSAAKRAAELAVDMTQQAYKNLPEDSVVIGAAKIARAYDFVMNAFISAVAGDDEAAKDWANQAKEKADEAIAVNQDVKTLAEHVKNRADEILSQL